MSVDKIILFGATMVLVFLLLSIAVVDWKRQIIPNAMNLLLALSGLCLSWFEAAGSLVSIIIQSIIVTLAAALIAGIYRFLRRRHGIGWGDVKFVGASSFWVGAQLVPWMVLIASLSGLAHAAVLQFKTGEVVSTSRLPFGPHLCVGLLVVWLVTRVG